MTEDMSSRPLVETIKPYWHEQNPWKDRLIYVPVSELANCTIRVGENGLPHGENNTWTMVEQIAHWTQYGYLLDAYILNNSVLLQGGVRFGPKPHHYLSPAFSLPKLVELRRRYTPKKGS